MMDGDMWVESSVTIGSTFYFTLKFQVGIRIEAKKEKIK
jgi:signal transduction histidine kinase